MSENMFEFKGKASLEWKFESDMKVKDLIDHAIDNIKDELGCLGEFIKIKVAIKKGKPIDDEREE